MPRALPALFLFFKVHEAFTHSMKRPHALTVLWLAAALPLAFSLVALPVDFVAVEFKPEDGLLYPLAYDNGTQLAVFVRGLQFGTPGTPLALLVDTGSSLTHILGAGCRSSCGRDLPESLGFNASASRTARLLPCDDACAGCAICRCAELPGGQQYCAYNYSYADGSLTTGALVADQVSLLGGSGGGGVRVPLTFGVEERQYGRLYSLGADGLLALDRSARSFIGQLRGELNATTLDAAAFATCWEIGYHALRPPAPGANASSFLLLGQPPAVVEALNVSWTPLLNNDSTRWEVGLEGIDILPAEGDSLTGGGSIEQQLHTWAPPGVSGSGAGGACLPAWLPGGGGGAGGEDGAGSSSSADSSSSAASSSSGAGSSGSGAGSRARVERPYTPTLVDSGTTYLFLPAPALAAAAALINASALATGLARPADMGPGLGCWEAAAGGGGPPSAEAFPAMRLRFSGGASFVAEPSGYLEVYGQPGRQFACLAVFPSRCTTAATLGNRLRHRVVTLHDDAAGRVGWAAVEGCAALAQEWEQL